MDTDTGEGVWDGALSTKIGNDTSSTGTAPRRSWSSGTVCRHRGQTIEVRAVSPSGSRPLNPQPGHLTSECIGARVEPGEGLCKL